jgi:glyoxylase-like metal-dependent hydrolase (beta-lactamase superfamily II)
MKNLLCKTIVVGPFFSNCYILICGTTSEGIIIDPGDEPTKIINTLKKYKPKIKYILLTHAHVDHTRGIPQIKLFTGAPIYLHKADLPLYQNSVAQAQKFGLYAEEPPPVDFFLKNGDIFEFGKFRLSTIHTPGHSPGGVCFMLDSEDRKMLFSGDTLFAGSIGRTDFWGGSYEQLIDSIKTRLLQLDEKTLVYPGHGEQTTIQDEKLTNPFLC